jgi:hypothetical protein
MKKYIVLALFPILLSCKKEKETPATKGTAVQKKDSAVEPEFKSIKILFSGISAYQ